MDKKTFIIIPAFNEEKSIANVLSSLLKEGYDNIVVIDDCSKDNTYNVAAQFPVNILKHSINRGQGAALKTGMDFALKKGADIIVTFDSDGQHSVEDIKKLTVPIENREVDIATGSRFLENTTNAPFTRRIFLRGGAFLLAKMYRLKLTDSHNGIRALSRHAAKNINIKSDRMEHASEVLEEISKKRIKHKEIPVTITYTSYSLQRGQRTRNAFNILAKMFWRNLIKRDK